MASRKSDENSRADKIRARRQQSRKDTQVNPFGNSASRKPSTRRVPVTRHSSSVTPIVSREKRKTNVPLKSKGSEWQLPAFPRLHFGWRLISAAIFLLSLFVVISFSSLSTFKVSAIALEGAQRLSEDAILSDIDLIGSSIITLQPEEIRAQIEDNFPGLSNVDVSVGLPAVVSIQVTERHPLILWQWDDKSYWIDPEGVLFPPQGEAEVTLTVVAKGDPPAAKTLEKIETNDETEEEGQDSEDNSTQNPVSIERTTPEFVQGIIALNEIIPEDSFLQYDPEFGLGWMDPRGWQVYFGRDTADIDLKLVEYETIIAMLIEQNLTPSVISLEFINAPFYRLE